MIEKMWLIKLNQTLNVTCMIKNLNDSIICHIFILHGIKEREYCHMKML